MVTSESEIWRRIPPEEKLRLIARAQANGVLAALYLLLSVGTVGVGLKLEWLIWGAVIASPLVFQMNSGRAWRRLRPKLMLEYLAARSASRRYAFTCNAQDLGVTFLFRGFLSRKYNEDQEQDELEDTINNARNIPVWITLFRDAVIIISEGPGGAKLEFGQVINDKLIIQSEEGGRRAEALIIGVRDREKGEALFQLTSDCPAALVVFEKKLLIQREEIRRINERRAVVQQLAIAELGEE